VATTTDYVGRSYDLVAWQGADDKIPAGAIVPMRPTLADDGEGGTIVTGVQKMSQRATLLLLTERFSLKYASGVGSRYAVHDRSPARPVAHAARRPAGVLRRACGCQTADEKDRAARGPG